MNNILTAKNPIEKRREKLTFNTIWQKSERLEFLLFYWEYLRQLNRMYSFPQILFRRYLPKALLIYLLHLENFLQY